MGFISVRCFKTNFGLGIVYLNRYNKKISKGMNPMEIFIKE